MYGKKNSCSVGTDKHKTAILTCRKSLSTPACAYSVGEELFFAGSRKSGMI